MEKMTEDRTPFEIGLVDFLAELEKKRKKEATKEAKKKTVAVAPVTLNVMPLGTTVSDFIRTACQREIRQIWMERSMG